MSSGHTISWYIFKCSNKDVVYCIPVIIYFMVGILLTREDTCINASCYIGSIELAEPRRFFRIEVPLLCQKSDWSCICVLRVVIGHVFVC